MTLLSLLHSFKLRNHISSRDARPRELVLLEYIGCTSPRSEKQNKAYDEN
jgi:hypothetical protein